MSLLPNPPPPQNGRRMCINPYNYIPVGFLWKSDLTNKHYEQIAIEGRWKYILFLKLVSKTIWQN